MNTGDSIVGVVAHVGTAATAPALKLCTECREPIPQKRLAVQPDAEQCVRCLESMGDVPRIKRYDEHTTDGDVVSTLFTRNKDIEHQISRVNNVPAPSASYEQAVGDDSHLTKPEKADRAAYSLDTAFEKDEEPAKVATPTQSNHTAAAFADIPPVNSYVN